MADDSVYICNDCQQWTNDPITLPCFHNLCLKCFESFKKDSSKCPVCRIDFEMIQFGMENQKIKKQMEPDQDHGYKKCDICKNTKALQFCVDCSCNYCSSCLEPHGRIPATRNHHLEPIPSKSKETVTMKQPTCKEHSDLIKAFCKSCKVYICSRCLITTHKNHMVNHMSEQLDILKDECEKNLKKKLKILEKVDSNSKGCEDTILEIHLKASSMINDIKQRGEDVKNEVDSIVAKLIKIVEQELQHHKNRADIAMRKIESIKTTLKVEIEALKYQLNDLKVGNVPEMSSNIISDIDIDTKFSEKWNIFFYFDADEEMTLTQRIFGNIERVPKLEQIKMETFNGKIQCFALDKGDVIFCNYNEYQLEICRQGVCLTRVLHCLKGGLDKIQFVIIDNFFFLAVSNNNIYYVFKYHLVFSGDDLRQIHNRPLSQEGHMVRLSKSLNGNILLVLSRKIIHLSPNGEVFKELDISFDIFDALELDKKRYVVSRLSEICTIDCEGNILLTYSCCNNPPLSFDIRALSVAKDNRRNIYVSDYWKKEILVLDHCLNFRSAFPVAKNLLDIVYDETSDQLMASSYDSKNSIGETLGQQTSHSAYAKLMGLDKSCILTYKLHFPMV